MKKIKIYIAGKVSPDSEFGRHNWRDQFCRELARLTGFSIFNLDPTKYSEEFEFDENDHKLVVGRDSHMIKKADCVIVNLTDDISVGASQEMLIAKYYKKPLIGLAKRGGKFNKDEKLIQGKLYKNYKSAFVLASCDMVIETLEELATSLKKVVDGKVEFKTLNFLDEFQDYYQKNFLGKDTLLRDL